MGAILAVLALVFSSIAATLWYNREKSNND
ncbi:hypothetical protein ERICI_03211 [Paenibacillus larvae subsp. larvae]|uniref:Uncharacterized protein n=1 Tax=Paenibacillus larvae subsp. larvae TaxID=147375 RepID=A0A2L1U7K0_9BACL|nr:hypothetical protein ERICI_03211 [Paenibacillus larvae subsp. larvae]AVF28900.1 hypothetical protein ERICIII_04898 [Paenibacillus larvae subsp. larvae]ETK26350.1 hypothetical protein ERIC1_2c05480 [Paenibacillus larvae subsp. larvae DSM 25719]QHZ53262.1 hypothetical protein ERICV_04201 [Paenibacillus larvae subsp. larvae]